MATTLITGPGIATSEVYILTRDVPTIRVKDPIIGNNGPMIVYYGARFEHVVELTHPIVGTVRDKDTGAPIAGVHITGMPNIPRSLITSPGVEATTDAQGRYQVNGLSTVRGFKLFTEAARRPALRQLWVHLPGGRRQARPDHLRHRPEARGAGAAGA